MQTIVKKNYEEISQYTAGLICDQVRRKPDSILCLPAGNSPTRTLELLHQIQQEGGVDFSRCRFVGLDEWVGIPPEDPGSCKGYVYRNFFEPLQIRPEQIVFFDACAQDLQNECDKVNAWLTQNGPIDLVLIGMGMNGHIGLNEPGSSFSEHAHLVDLDETTRRVCQKYFTTPVSLTRGITLGFADILSAAQPLLIVNGKNKAPVVKELIDSPVTEDFPASALKQLPNAMLLLDEDAASLL